MQSLPDASSPAAVLLWSPSVWRFSYSADRVPPTWPFSRVRGIACFSNRCSRCCAEARPRVSGLLSFSIFFFFFYACTEFVLSTLRRSPSVGFAVCHQARLFVFSSICQKIASNQIPLLDVRRDSCARWAELSNVSTFSQFHYCVWKKSHGFQRQ